MTWQNTEAQSVPKHGLRHARRHTDPSSHQLVWEFSWPMAIRGICRVMLCHLPTIMPDYLHQCWLQQAFLCCSDTRCVGQSHLHLNNSPLIIYGTLYISARSPSISAEPSSGTLLKHQVRFKVWLKDNAREHICCKEDQSWDLPVISFPSTWLPWQQRLYLHIH